MNLKNKIAVLSFSPILIILIIAIFMFVFLNSFISEIINKKIQVSLVTTREPVLINRGKFGTTEFLRFRAPVSISYFGGAKPIIQNQIVEILVLRVPAHQSPKGLAIAQYNMGGV